MDKRFRRAAQAALWTAAVLAAVFLGKRIRLYVVESGSMEPAIATGSLCVVDTEADIRGIKENGIIAFETANGTLVAHRVVRITESGLETKGDANRVRDGSVVTEANFRGKVLFAIPGAGYAASALQRLRIPVAAAAAVLLLSAGLCGALCKMHKTGSRR